MNIVIPLGVSAYNVIRYWAEDFGRVFREYGHLVYVWDVTKGDWPYGSVSADVFFAPQGWGVWQEDDGSTTDYSKQILGRKTNMIHVHYFLDNPIYHIKRIFANIENRLALYCDESYDEFVTQGLKTDITAGGFLPHPGICYNHGKGEWPQKDIDVLFTSTARAYGTQRKFNFLEQIDKKHKLNGKTVRLANDIIDYLQADKGYKGLWEGVCDVCKHQKISVNDFTPAEICMLSYAVDENLRNWKKGVLLDFAVKNQWKVHVYGPGWEDHPLSNKLFGKYPVDYLETIALNARAKISINSNGNHTHGSHERVFNALLNGAIPLTEGSSYFEKELSGLFLTMSDGAKVDKLLTDNEYFEQMSRKAMAVAKKKHTLEKRAQKVLKYINDFRQYVN